jgi:ribosome maturation factor RimP
MTVADRVHDLVLPLLVERDLDLYDIEVSGRDLKVVVDRPAGGLDLDVLADATRAVSRALDEADPIAGAYTLEVSSPGLERKLRTPRHFARAVGETVRVKLTPAAGDAREGERRLEGEITAADDDGVTLRTTDGDETRLAYDDIDRARTVFAWGPAPKPGKGRRPSAPTARAGAGAAGTTTDEKRDQRP